MTTGNGHPPTLEGCDVLPPMETVAPGQTGARTGASGRANGERKPSHRKTANRFAVLNAFVDCTLAGLPRADIAVWLVLYRDTRRGIAETSQGSIAKRAGISVRTVRRALAQLERCGLLRTVYRGGLNRGASKYRVSPTKTPPNRERT